MDRYLVFTLIAFKEWKLIDFKTCDLIKEPDDLRSRISEFRKQNSDCWVELRLDKITLHTPVDEHDDWEEVEMIAKYTWGNPTINFLTLEDLFNIYNSQYDTEFN